MCEALGSVPDHIKNSLECIPVISAGDNKKMKNLIHAWIHRVGYSSLAYMGPCQKVNGWMNDAWMINYMLYYCICLYDKIKLQGKKQLLQLKVDDGFNYNNKSSGRKASVTLDCVNFWYIFFQKMMHLNSSKIKTFNF